MKTIYKVSALLFCFLLSIVAAGQTVQSPPSDDIYLVDISNRKGEFKLGQPVNITRREGYDNQPSFLPDGKALLYTSIGDDGQADIYIYSLINALTGRMTRTPESEYSPTVMPGGKFFSVVRVEADKTQRLWKFPMVNEGKPSLVLEKIKPVGYHLWIDAGHLALFILGQPNTLQLVDVATEKTETIAENIGRTLALVPRRNQISFIHKVSDNEWLIKAFDLKTRQINTLIKTLPGNEFYAWSPGGTLFMAEGAKLFKWKPNEDKDWQQVADFSSAGLKMITRLAFNPKGDKLAFVAH